MLFFNNIDRFNLPDNYKLWRGNSANWGQSFYKIFKLVQTGASLVAQWVKNPPANARDTGSIPGSGRSPQE